MNFNITKSITNSIAKIGHTLLTNKWTARPANFVNNNAPTILTVGGIVLNGIALYQALKKGPEVKQIIEESKAETETVIANLDNDPNVSEKEAKTVVINTKRNHIVRCLKALAPVIAIAMAANAMSVGACAIANHRLNTTTLLLENEIGAFAAYRNAVVEKYGADEDKKLRYGETTKVVTNVDPATGEVTSEEEVNTWVPDPTDRNLIKVGIDGGLWSPDPASVSRQIRCKVASLNDQLERTGFVFKGTIQNYLDAPYTLDSFTTGYIFAKERPDHFGMSKIDYKIHYPADSLGDYWVEFNFDKKPINKYIPHLLAYQRGADI